MGLALVAIALACASGCGTGADGVDACKQIEDARCKLAPACGIELTPPYHTAGTDVDACIRYYDVACLHGLEVGDPGPTVVHACVAAINNCATVSAPETSAACAWLAPTPSAASEAGSDKPATVDAAAD